MLVPLRGKRSIVLYGLLLLILGRVSFHSVWEKGYQTYGKILNVALCLECHMNLA